MMRELEQKFDVDDDYELPDLEPVLTSIGAEMTAPEERVNVDVYHDTADLRLLRWGCTVRHRRGKGWTVKLPSTEPPSDDGSDQALDRVEIELGGRAGKPPPKARALVSSLSRREPLEAVATVTNNRTAYLVGSADGRPLLEIADDRVSAELSGGETVTFRQLEVELAPEANAAVLDPVVEALTESGARPQAGDIKLAVALGVTGSAPDVVVPSLGGKPRSRDVIQRAIARSVRQLVMELPRARLGLDDEGIHQARVATRRLRSDFRTFKPLLDDAWVASVTPRLRELAADLGRVRDADVLHELLQRTVMEHTEIDPEAADEVLAAIAAERDEARTVLDRYLNRVGTARLLDELVAATVDPPVTAEADQPARRQLPTLVIKRWRRLEKAVNALGRRADVEGRHRVRILAKRVRYATEAIMPAFGRNSRRFAGSLATLQDTLGDLNDAVVAEAWLNRHGPGLSPPAAYAAGRLAEVYSILALADAEWSKDWARIRRRRPGWLAG